MNADHKEEILVRVRAELKKTEAKIIDYEALCKPIGPENSIGRVSRMDAINNKSIYEAALRTAKDKRNKLETVLTKIDDPDFGDCQRCKQPIPLMRLVLLPESSLCVNCAR